MKKYLLMMILPLFFIACTNPMLKWIETPADVSSSGVESGSGGRSGNDGDGNNDDVTPPPAGLNSDKAITGFSFGISGEEISIRGEPDQNGKTPIKAILPMGSPLNLTPSEIEIIGKSVSPQQGQPQNFSSPKDYRVFAEDGSFRDYVVEVTVRTPESAEIVWFDLEIPDRPNSPAEGVVNQPPVGSDTGEIIVHVPSGTSLENLTAKIAQTGQTIGDAQGHTDTKLAAVLTSNFSSTVNYTITSGDGNTTTQYVVTVITDKSDVKEITAFSFVEAGSNGHVMIGAAPQADGKIPIVVTVPLTATPSALTPKITYKGAAVNGRGVSVARTITLTTNFADPDTVNGSEANFSTPAAYTVTAEDGSTTDYEVTVFQGDLNSSKQITGFYFILPTTTAAGIINEMAKTISVTVPFGTNLTSLTPTIYHTGVSISPDSGASRNFSGTVSYTVKAADNSTQAYQVSVTVAKNNAKAITAFDFTNVGGETTVIGSTPVNGKIPIVVTVPYTTNLVSLTPVITHTGASISGGGIPGGGGVGTRYGKRSSGEFYHSG